MAHLTARAPAQLPGLSKALAGLHLAVEGLGVLADHFNDADEPESFFLCHGLAAVLRTMAAQVEHVALPATLALAQEG